MFFFSKTAFVYLDSVLGLLKTPPTATTETPACEDGVGRVFLEQGFDGQNPLDWTQSMNRRLGVLSKGECFLI